MDTLSSLTQALERTYPAQTTLGCPTDAFEAEASAERQRGDLIYVQGRSDRLHALLLLQDGDVGDDALWTRFAPCEANWCWAVCEPNEERVALERAAAHNLGVLVIEGGGLRVARKAPPRPGIFIKSYKELRKEWRALSAW